MRGKTALEKYESEKINLRLAYLQSYQGDVVLGADEVALILDTQINVVYDLMKYDFLSFLVLGSKKVRKSTLDNFLKDYEGVDITKIIKSKKEASN